MTSAIIKCALAGIALFAMMLISPAGASNLIKNPGMESSPGNKNIPEFWELVTFKGLETDADSEWSDVRHTGAKSLCILWKRGAQKVAAQPALTEDIKPGRKYKIKAYAFSDEEGESCISFETFDQDSRLLQSGQFSSKISDAKDWRLLEWDFSTHSATKSAKIYFMSTGKGKVWFDDTGLEETGNAEADREDFPIKYSCEPVDGNAFWNGNRPVFHTIKNSPTCLNICFWGDRERVHNPKVVFDVPEGLSIPEVYSSRSGLSAPYLAPIRLENPQQEPSGRAGKNYIRYVVENPHALNFRSKTVSGSDSLTIYLNGAEDNPDKEYNVFWHLENDGIQSGEEKIIVKVLPPMEKTPAPKRFRGFLWGADDLNCFDTNLLANAASKYEEANIHGRSRIDPPHLLGTLGKHIHDVDQVLKQRGWLLYTGFYSYLYRSKNDAGAVDKKGIESKTMICPTFFLSSKEAQDNYRKELKRITGTLEDTEMFIHDFEPSGLPRNYCFCNACLDNFASQSGIARGELSSPEVILTKYRLEWSAHWVRIIKGIYRLSRELLGEINPTWKIGEYDYLFRYKNGVLCSGYGGNNEVDTMLTMPKDPRKAESFFDFHLFSLYGDNGIEALDLMENNVRTLAKPVWFMPLLARAYGVTASYTKPQEALDPWEMQTKILASALAGGKGLGIYPGDSIDGMYFKTIDEAMTDIAEFEDYFSTGEDFNANVKLKGLPAELHEKMVNGAPVMDSLPVWDKFLTSRAFRLKDKVFLVIFNFHRTYPAFAKVNIRNLSGGKRVVLQRPAGNIFARSNGDLAWEPQDLDQEGLLVEVPPKQYISLLIEPSSEIQDRDMPSLKTIKPDETMKAYEGQKAIKKMDESFKPLTAEGFQVSRGGLEDRGNLIIVETDSQKIWIDTQNGGQVIEWFVKDEEVRICRYNPKGNPKIQGLFCDLFWLPSELRWNGAERSDYKLQSARIVDQQAVIALQNIRAADGLAIDKTYIISRLPPRIRIDYTVKNIGGKSKSFSFWSHNCPNFGIENDPGKGVFIKIPVDGQETILPDVTDDSEVVYVKKDLKEKSGFEMEKIKGVLTGGWINVSKKGESGFLKIDFEFEKAMQTYICRGTYLTAELMCELATLDPNGAWKTTIKITYQNGIQ